MIKLVVVRICKDIEIEIFVDKKCDIYLYINIYLVVVVVVVGRMVS